MRQRNIGWRIDYVLASEHPRHARPAVRRSARSAPATTRRRSRRSAESRRRRPGRRRADRRGQTSGSSTHHQPGTSVGERHLAAVQAPPRAPRLSPSPLPGVVRLASTREKRSKARSRKASGNAGSVVRDLEPWRARSARSRAQPRGPVPETYSDGVVEQIGERLREQVRLSPRRRTGARASSEPGEGPSLRRRLVRLDRLGRDRGQVNIGELLARCGRTWRPRSSAAR